MSKIAVKHLPLFLPGVLLFSVEGFDEPEQFPNLSEGLLNTDMGQVKKFIEKHWLQQGFSKFIEAAKSNFGLEPTEKLLPQVWADAVTSYKVAKGSVKLQLEPTADEEKPNEDPVLDAKRSYSAAIALAGTAVSFAQVLEPAHFEGATSMEDFISLLPAAPEQVVEAVATAQEQTPAPTPEATAAPEQVAVVEPETPAAQAPVAPTTSAPAPNVTSVVPANANAALGQIIAAFNQQDDVLAATEQRFGKLADDLRTAQTTTVAEIRTANAAVRNALLQAVTGEEVPTPAIEANV